MKGNTKKGKSAESLLRRKSRHQIYTNDQSIKQEQAPKEATQWLGFLTKSGKVKN